MKMQEGRRFQNDGGAEDCSGPHQQSTETCNDPIRKLEIGGSFPTAVQDPQLMSELHRFGDNRTKPTGLGQPKYCDEQVKQETADLTHCSIVSRSGNPWKTANCGIRQEQEEYRRFMDFLRRSDCRLDFRPYRKITN